MTKTLDIKLGIYLIISFILFTIVGTVSHEIGHYAFAKLLGLDASINYAHTQWTDLISRPQLDQIYEKYSNEIPKGIDYPEKQKYEAIVSKMIHDDFIITIGGPLQTMLTGTIGLLILFSQRKKYFATAKLDIKQWLLIFLTLFWLRQLFNFAHGIIKYIMVGHFPYTNDEATLARHLQINELSITSLTAIIAAAILYIIVFKYIPISQRLTFCTSGLIGGLLGFYIWLILLGPIAMP